MVFRFYRPCRLSLLTCHWPIVFILHAIFNPEQWHLWEFLITFDLFLPAHECQFLESMEWGYFVLHYYVFLKLTRHHVSGFFFNVRKTLLHFLKTYNVSLQMTLNILSMLVLGENTIFCFILMLLHFLKTYLYKQ